MIILIKIDDDDDAPDDDDDDDGSTFSKVASAKSIVLATVFVDTGVIDSAHFLPFAFYQNNSLNNSGHYQHQPYENVHHYDQY